LLSDRDGTIQIWNQACTRIFGWTSEQAVGQTLNLIIPERQRARHWEGYHAAIERETFKYRPGEILAVPATRKDGARISIEFTVAPLKAAGITFGIVACIRDVSERRTQDIALRKHLAELERRAG
jgi:PAS domain S-box-containing protein